MRGLVERDSIPVNIVIVGRRYEPAYVIQEVYEISDEVTCNIEKILVRAGNEVKQYLEQELKFLEDKFKKIKVTNEN